MELVLILILMLCLVVLAGFLVVMNENDPDVKRSKGEEGGGT